MITSDLDDRMRLNNWSIAASYDTARIFAGLGFGSSTTSGSIISRPRRTGVRASTPTTGTFHVVRHQFNSLAALAARHAGLGKHRVSNKTSLEPLVLGAREAPPARADRGSEFIPISNLGRSTILSFSLWRLGGR
jgi:hypothetical protein